MDVSREEKWYPMILRVICLYNTIVKTEKNVQALFINYVGDIKEANSSGTIVQDLALKR